MGPSPDKCSFLFTNLAGGARKENCDPFAMGQFLATHPLLSEYPPVLIGCCECVRTGEGHVSASEQEQTLDWSVPTPSGELDDLTQFVAGLREGITADLSAAYLSVIDSRSYSSPNATTTKWGQGGSPRLSAPAQRGTSVHQGLAVVRTSPNNHWQATGSLIRVAGTQPASHSSNDPLAYDGTRDTEPRAAIICRGTLAGQPLVVAFTQFETNSADVGPDGRRALQPTGAGHENRRHQAKRIAELIAEDENSLVVGDFNVNPDAGELQVWRECGFQPLRLVGICESQGPGISSSAGVHSHLEHDYLGPIDYAWGKGAIAEAAQAVIFRLPNESPGIRVSDHRPVATVFRHDRGD